MGQSTVYNVNRNVDDVHIDVDVDVSSYLIRRALPYFDGIYVQGRLQGEDVLMTVDTGASITLVSSSVYQGLPDEMKPTLMNTTRRVKAADGEDLHCEGIAKFNLELGDEILLGTFVVADIQDDILLGADILQKDVSGPVDLILSEDRMVFRGKAFRCSKFSLTIHPHLPKYG